MTLSLSTRPRSAIRRTRQADVLIMNLKTVRFQLLLQSGRRGINPRRTVFRFSPSFGVTYSVILAALGAQHSSQDSDQL